MINLLRKPKIFNIAIFDTVATILVAYFFHTTFVIKCPLWSTILAFFIVGSLVHIMMGIPTMLNYYLGISKKPNRP